MPNPKSNLRAGQKIPTKAGTKKTPVKIPSLVKGQKVTVVGFARKQLTGYIIGPSKRKGYVNVRIVEGHHRRLSRKRMDEVGRLESRSANLLREEANIQNKKNETGSYDELLKLEERRISIIYEWLALEKTINQMKNVRNVTIKNIASVPYSAIEARAASEPKTRVVSEVQKRQDRLLSKIKHQLKLLKDGETTKKKVLKIISGEIGADINLNQIRRKESMLTSRKKSGKVRGSDKIARPTRTRKYKAKKLQKKAKDISAIRKRKIERKTQNR